MEMEGMVEILTMIFQAKLAVIDFALGGVGNADTHRNEVKKRGSP